MALIPNVFRSGRIVLWIGTTLTFGVGASHAIDLREATFTQVVNTVNVSGPQGNNSRRAEVSSKFTSPDIIRTGADSRAELTAADQTVTRVGANTIFSFKPEGRGINLQQGSVLFNSPTGRGGGTIQTAAATASVLGTTIIVTTTSNGGFKLLVLEGKAKATLQNGRSFNLISGQMTFIVPGMTRTPPIFEFRLSKQNQGSGLVKGFKKSLPAQNKIDDAIDEQEKKIAQGDKTDTGYTLGDVIDQDVQVIDPNTIQVVVNSELESLVARLQQALAVDQTISSSTLSPDPIFFGNSQLLDSALSIVGTQGYTGGGSGTTYIYAARVLNIQTSTLNLSPYSNAQTFAFYGKEQLQLPGSLTISGFSGDLVFHSDLELTIFSSTNVNYNGSSLEFECLNYGGLNLSYVNLTNSGGSLSLTNFAGGISLIAGIYTGTDIDFTATDDIDMTGTMFATDNLGIYAGGDLSLTNPSFSTSVSGITLISGAATTLSSITWAATDIFAHAGTDLISNTGNSFTTSNSITFGAGSGTLLINTNTISGDNSVALYGYNINITGSTVSSSGLIQTIGGSGLTSINNSTFSSPSGNYGGVNFVSTNSTFLASSGNLTFSATTATFSGGTVSASNNINVNATNVDIDSTTFYADKIKLAVVGTINVKSGTFTANQFVAQGNTVNMGSATYSAYINGTSSLSSTASLSANMSSGLLSVSNTTFSNFSSVSMNAYTINLTNVNFGAGQQVYLTSGVANSGGIPNFGTSIPGRVNFISGVYYGGNNIYDASTFGVYGSNIHLNQ